MTHSSVGKKSYYAMGYDDGSNISPRLNLTGVPFITITERNAYDEGYLNGMRSAGKL